MIPQDLANDFVTNVKTTYDTAFQKCERGRNAQLNNLISPHVPTCNRQQNWLKNLSHKQLPPSVSNILSLGQKFNIKPNNQHINSAQIIASLEPEIQKLNANDKTELRQKVANIITNFKHARTKRTTKEQVLLQQMQEAKAFLKENEDILVVNADKGNETVVLSKEQYHSKMMAHLTDANTYLVLNKDPTASIERNVNALLTKWQNEDIMTDEKAKYMRSYTSVCPKIYLQIKTHKEGNPGRPVVSFIDAPTYKLSKMFADILKNVVGKTHRTVRNSREFKRRISKIRLPKGFEMISLDATSLFTNVSKELTIMAINTKWKNISKFTNLPKDEFINGITLIMDNCCFQYDNIFYKQIYGSPMGSPVSPHLADLVLEILQEKVISKLSFHLPYFYRYVDDINTAVPKEKKKEILDMFNKYDHRLQFTMEEERNNNLAFLDIMCIREGQAIKTNWYHKSTWSGRYLNYGSHLPMQYKRNTISILTQKILELADPEYHAENFELLHKTLSENGYPKRFINDMIQQTKAKFNPYKPDENLHKEGKDRYNMAAIPYVSGLFEHLKFEMKKHDIKLVAKADNNLKMSIFSRVKDKTPILQQAGVVYEIPCTCEKRYLGMTGQLLGKRTYQHKHAIETGDEGHSGLCEHAIQTGHKPRWSGVRIVYKENNWKKRAILETIAIKKSNGNNLNKQTESQFLPVAYSNII
ncbi:uncharacterized protein LOC119069023 [Bradysia coprophila]|uniref:uncharacterized protein LOC119069023 n=1 Tax=Bradysia coprophila TaxID=38358 RepID=UPI00187DA0B7|nr:uncharacterized protein LOC119069023 [Bradysia coprophila]